MERLTAIEIAKMTGGKLVFGNPLTECVNAEIDSRRVKEEFVFFAIKGSVTDGHLFIESAVSNGATVIVIEKPFETLNLSNKAKEAAYIEVLSGERALGALALAYRIQYQIPIIGVTGSVGKTTTKEMIYAVMSEKCKTLKSEGNFNSETGLPISVLKITNEDKAAVLEMGMDAAGEIDYLTKIARPTVGVITNIGISHIETLGSRKNILKAKLEIQNGLGADGTMVLNADDEMLFNAGELIMHPAIYYGIENKKASYRAENIRYYDDKTEFTVVTPYEKFEAAINAPGKHNVLNALAATVAGYLSGLTTKEIVKGLLAFKTEKMRQTIYKFEDFTVMEDCYNASPDSMNAAFEVIKNRKEKRKIAVLADMLELGDETEKHHFETGKNAANALDKIICYGSLGEKIAEGANSVKEGVAVFVKTSDEAAKLLAETVLAGDVILFKASRGMKAEECIIKFKESVKK